jgi:hypothetical protein
MDPVHTLPRGTIDIGGILAAQELQSCDFCQELLPPPPVPATRAVVTVATQMQLSLIAIAVRLYRWPAIRPWATGSSRGSAIWGRLSAMGGGRRAEDYAKVRQVGSARPWATCA